MKTKQLWIGLAAGLGIGFWGTYLYFISTSTASAADKVFVIIGGTTGILSALVYFFQKFYEHHLGILAEQKKITFANTYKLRTDTISEAHGRLIALYDAVMMYSGASINEHSENHEAASSKIYVARNELIDFLALKELYLPKSTALKIRELFQMIFGNHIGYTMFKHHRADERSGEIKNWLIVKTETIPAALKLLEEDMRREMKFED